MAIRCLCLAAAILFSIPVFADDPKPNQDKSVNSNSAATTDIGAAAEGDPEVWDPIEPVNRGIFWFNDEADTYVIRPLSKGYDYVMTDTAEEGVTNFFKNLRYPMYLVSDVIQFKFSQAVDHTGRFLINTTIGVVGLVDVAKHVGLEDHEEDVGVALAYHGVPPGPYIVLPFVGPSNLRDTFGFAVDTVLNPFYWVGYAKVSSDEEFGITVGSTALKALQTRVSLDDAISAAKEGSLDYYLFVQSAYYQHRRGLVYDGAAPGIAQTADDLEKEMDQQSQAEAPGS